VKSWKWATPSTVRSSNGIRGVDAGLPEVAVERGFVLAVAELVEQGTQVPQVVPEALRRDG